jgi:pimeloyl-ACP methyl ester carboxylesterase
MQPRLAVERHMLIARALYHLDSAELIGRVRVPVLFLLALRGGAAGGREDPRLGAVETALRGLPSGSAVRWIEGGHDLPVQRPREVAAAVVEFLAAVGA